MIRTPNHDSIMLWLDAEIPTLLPAIAPSGWNTEELRYWETKSAAPIPDWPGIEIRDKVWEQPLTNHRHFTEGYADLAVNAHVPCLSESWERQYKISIGYETVTFLFEVKPKIESLGELLRQLQRYRRLWPRGHWYVVSPDIRYERLVREQGFGFVASPGQLPFPL